MALERKNISIPISGGVNQAEDGYLLKPPSLDVINGYYQKDGSIKKRGAYQFLQAGFSSSAVPFALGDALHVVDGSSIYKWKDPASVSLKALGASTISTPPSVHTLPSQNDGAFEVVAAANGSTVTVLWSQPVPPDPDSADTDYKKHFNLFLVQYDEENLAFPVAGPFKVLDSSSPVDMEELSLIYTGGFWCVTGIRRSDSQLRTAVFQTLSSGNLTWQTVNNTSAVSFYDVTYTPGTASLYYVLQYQNDTSSTTAASRTWGITQGVVAAINGIGSLSFSRATLGSIGTTDNYVGDKAVAIHVKGSVLWFAAASVRHDNLYVYTTNLSLGSISSATLVHTHVIQEPWVNGNWAGFLTPGKGSRAYPYYEDQASVAPITVNGTWGVEFGGGNDRVGRLAFSSTTAGVRLFWDGPIITDTTLEYWGGYGPGVSYPAVWGTAWKTVSDALSVGSSLGYAACSYMASKPLSSGDQAQLVLGMSSYKSYVVNNPFSPQFTPKNSARGLFNNWFNSEPSKIGAWRMAQFCLVEGDTAVPVAHFGADALSGREWGLSDAARLYTKGTHEPPQLSTRRMEHLFETSQRRLIFGTTYLVRGAPTNYERPGPTAFSYNASLDAHLNHGVVVSLDQSLSPRSVVTVVGGEAYLANGWMLVYDGDDVREASPNFIPPAPVFADTDQPGTEHGAQVSWFVVDKANRTLRSSRSLVTLNSNDPASINVYNSPPCFSGTAGRSRFEVWGTTDTSSDYRRAGVGDPSSFSTSGPFIFKQRFICGTGEPLVTSSELLPEPLGGCIYVTATSNRVWYIEPEDTARVRFSKDFSVLGQVEFNRSLYVDVPDGSRPVAVATLDEQVVIFTETSVFLLVGNLPNNSGGGANFYLQKVAFEDGCSNRYSVFPSRVGVFFESDRGINLLTRGYEVVFVGSAVEDSAFGGNSVTGVSYLPQEDIYLFTTSNEILVCHEAGNEFRWTRWAFEHDADIVASCAWGNYHVILDSEGTLHYMDMSVVTDVQLTVTTPWMYFGDLEGFQRIRDINLVGRNESLSPAGSAAIQIGYDFADAFSETVYYEYGVSTAAKPLRIRFKPGIQKTSSFRLRYTEVGETVGQAVILEADITLAGIAVEAGVKSLGNKVARNTPTTPS